MLFFLLLDELNLYVHIFHFVAETKQNTKTEGLSIVVDVVRLCLVVKTNKWSRKKAHTQYPMYLSHVIISFLYFYIHLRFRENKTSEKRNRFVRRKPHQQQNITFCVQKFVKSNVKSRALHTHLANNGKLLRVNVIYHLVKCTGTKPNQS